MIHNMLMIKSNCAVCGKEFETIKARVSIGWGIYCSRSCQHKSMRKGLETKCAYCQKKIYRSQKSIKRSKSGRYFCGHLCQLYWFNKQKNGERHPNWQGGKQSYRKNMIRTSKSVLCKKCGLGDIRILTVHHIDKNRDNNNIENLEWLCLNCHHLIHKHQEKI